MTGVNRSSVWLQLWLLCWVLGSLWVLGVSTILDPLSTMAPCLPERNSVKITLAIYITPMTLSVFTFLGWKGLISTIFVIYPIIGGCLLTPYTALLKKQVAIFLHVVCHKQRFTCINLTFKRSIETISRHFEEILCAVGELINELIQPPTTIVPTKIQNSRRWSPYFKANT